MGALVFDPTITLGNVLTVLAMLTFAAAIWARFVVLETKVNELWEEFIGRRRRSKAWPRPRENDTP